MADPMRLRQILLNLAGNAVKFTHVGEVRVHVKAGRLEGGVQELHFTVSDTGIGISPGQQQTIFEAFVQADGSMTRKYGGTGLRLAISSKLVQLMGGKIWLESERDKGSHFHFTIRVSPIEQERQIFAPESLTGLRALIVDDNDTNRRILRHQLSRWGMRVECAGDGFSALDMLKESCHSDDPYQVVLLDAQMPEMSGFEVAAEIQTQSRLHGSAVMMLSSVDLASDYAHSRKLGIHRYLIKPVAEQDLRKAVLQVIEANSRQPIHRGSSLRTTARRPSEKRKSLEAVGSLNGLKILLAEDNPVNRKLAVRMLEKLGHTVQSAEDGLEALAALEKQPFDVVLMDVQMPHMDGLECTRAIRARDGLLAGLPIIALIANAMEGDEEICLQAGMDGYMSKPIRWDLLAEMLTEVARVPQAS